MAGGILVVSGLPASGKTTLAKKLAHDLAFVHLWRDGLKRPLQDVSAALPIDGRNLVGRAIDQLINTVAAEVLRAGHGVVIDSNFNIAEHGDAIRHLAAETRARCFEVCLWGDANVLRSRFIARADPPLTDDLRPYFEKVLQRERKPVLSPPTPIVELDTTDFDDLRRAEPGIVRRAHAAFELPQRSSGSVT